MHAYSFDAAAAAGVGVDAGYGLPLSPGLAWGSEIPLSPERDTLYPWFASAASVFGASLLSDDLQPSYYGGAQTALYEEVLASYIRSVNLDGGRYRDI